MTFYALWYPRMKKGTRGKKVRDSETKRVRVPLNAQKRLSKRQSLLCHIVPNHRTFIDDYLKILDFIDWLRVAYPEKAKFLAEKS